MIKALIHFLPAILMLFSCASEYSGKVQPRVVNGTLNLTAWDFEEDGPVRLDGDWEIYWNKLLSPADLKKTESIPSGYIAVPSTWADKSIENQLLPVKGVATYRLRVKLPNRLPESLALRIPSIDTAYRYYMNEKILAENGFVGDTENTSRPVYYAPLLQELHVKSEIDLIINLSNFHYPRPGIRDSIILGDKKTVASIFERNLVIDIFLIGAIFIMGLYHLGVFYLRRSDRSSLYFALFCLASAGRLLVTGEGYAYRLPWFNWNIGTTLEYILYYWSLATCGLYIKTLYPEEVSAPIIKSVVYICLIFTAFVLATPIMFYARTLLIFNIYVAVMICYIGYTLIKAVMHNREAAKIFMTGSIILYLTVLNDILYNYRITPVAYTVPYGLYTFFIVQSFILSSRFSKAFSSVEELSHDLEVKVIERTKELEIEKEKLRKSNEIMDRDLDMARTLQEKLVPMSSPVDYISSLYKPMSKVGGDFFDFIKCTESDRIGIFLSDVSGHGVSGAFITSMIKSILLQTDDIKSNPSELLKYINKVLYNNTGGNFCTAFYGIYDNSAKTIKYSIAGHNKPYIISKEGIYQLNGFSGIPIGILDNESIEKRGKAYVTTEESIPSGCKLLIYTDGFSETMSIKDENMFSEDGRLDSILPPLIKLSSKKFIDDLYGILVDFRGDDSFEDDVCLICVDVK